MDTEKGLRNLGRLDSIIESILHASRIPGIAAAVVIEDRTVFAKGYGLRDLDAHLPLTAQTVYPIASTTKGINATLLAMLIEEGRLAWDAPVQTYLPSFRLREAASSMAVTLRDLVVMRTGLPLHDWLRAETPINRAELAARLQYLEPSAAFRERFQYSNLTVTVAGYIAEAVMGRGWEELVRERILEPLGMSNTVFSRPDAGNVTQSYHENTRRELRLTERLSTRLTAPAGGTMHSTVEDMARWIAFNLSGGKVSGRALLKPQTLAELHSPQISAGADPTAPTPHATYAMGWFVDTYNDCWRLSHGGFLNDVNTSLMLFPKQHVGMVAFSNFASSRLARFVNEQAFDLMMGFEPERTLELLLRAYEAQIESTRRHNVNVPRVANTSPSHALDEYAGVFVHPAYGAIEIRRTPDGLSFARGHLVLPLEHWHYDAWVVAENDRFEIHKPHAFDRASRLLFDTNADGDIAGVSIRLEPAVAPIRFEKQ